MGVGFLPQSRQRRQDELKRAQQDLATARERLAELAVEGRREGYPERPNPEPRPGDRGRR